MDDKSPEENKPKTIKDDLLKDLYDLNENFYELFGRFNKYKGSLSKKLQTQIEENLYNQYSKKYELLTLQSDTQADREIDRLSSLYKELVPRRSRLLRFLWRRRNEAAKQIDRQVDCEVLKFYNEQEIKIVNIEKELEVLNKQVAAIYHGADKTPTLPPSDNVPAAPMSEPAPSAPAPELVSKDKPTTEQEPPKATKRTRKPKAAPADVPEQPGQLQGQIGIEEINNK